MTPSLASQNAGRGPRPPPPAFDSERVTTMAGLLSLCIISTLYVFADTYFDFASYYADHMVLQMAPAKAIIWGYGVGGAVVTVTIFKENNEHMRKYTRIRGNTGIWKVALEPFDHGGPYMINARQYFQREVDSIILQDVFFGDVWVCGGQSNMEMTVLQIFNASKEMSEAHLYPYIRVFTTSRVQSKEELYDLAKIDLQWSIPTAENLGNGQSTYFSAVCWLYGRYLYDILQYPIGLVESCWKGTPVEAWSSTRALHKCGLPHLAERKIQESPDDPYFGPKGFSVLWNAMIHPLLSMTIKGAIWYQGEANTKLDTELYNCTFPAMIDDWRAYFHEGSKGQTDRNFPFGFVQLSTHNKIHPEDKFPIIRWHQTADFGYAPNPRMLNTFMAVAVDLGDTTSPYGCIHPRDKQSVAYRLALGARAVAYGEKGIRFQGPFPQKIVVVEKEAYMNITYDQKLLTKPANCSIFEVGCSLRKGDKHNLKWIPVKSMAFSADTVTVSVKGCCEFNISAVRYAWSDWACEYKQCPLYSVDSLLPAPPFVKHFQN